MGSCKKLLFTTMILAFSKSYLPQEATPEFSLKDVETKISILEKNLKQIEETKRKQILFYQSKIEASSLDSTKQIYQEGLAKFMANDLSRPQLESLAKLKSVRNELLLKPISKDQRPQNKQNTFRSAATKINK